MGEEEEEAAYTLAATQARAISYSHESVFQIETQHQELKPVGGCVNWETGFYLKRFLFSIARVRLEMTRKA